MTGRGGRGADLAEQLQVRALQRAVLGDVGDDVAGAALGVEAGEGLVQLAALLGPAAGGQPGAAHVEADGDAVAVLGDGAGAPLGRLQRRGAQVDPAAAGGQRGGQRLVVADAAGELDVDVQLADDAGQQLAVGAAAEGGVEVDEVHPLGAVALPLQRGLERVAVGRLAAGLPLHEADGLSVGDVDGGEELQLRHGDQPRSGGVRSTAAGCRRGVRRGGPPPSHGARLRPRPAGAPRGAGAAAGARDPGAVGRLQPGLGVPGAGDRRRSATASGRRPPTAGAPDGWLTRMRRAPLLVVPFSNKQAYLDRYAEPDKGWADRDEVALAGAVLGRRRRHGLAADAADRRRRGAGRLLLRRPGGPGGRAAGGVRRAGAVPAGRLPVGRLPRATATAARPRCAAAGAASTRSCTAGAGDRARDRPSSAGTTGPALHRLMEAALRASKRARTRDEDQHGRDLARTRRDRPGAGPARPARHLPRPGPRHRRRRQARGPAAAPTPASAGSRWRGATKAAAARLAADVGGTPLRMDDIPAALATAPTS